MQFFVYEVIDTRPGSGRVVYVGKGSGSRAKSHLKASHNLALRRFVEKSRREGFEPTVKVFAYFDDETEAFRCEIVRIAFHGRRDVKTGSLFNLTDGGEGTSGWIPTEAFRECLKNRTVSLKTREALRARHADPEFANRRNAWLAKTLSDPKAQKSRSDAISRRNQDPEFRRRKVDATKIAQTSPMVAEARLKRVGRMNADPEFRKRQAAAAKLVHSDKEFSQARDQRLAKLNADPEFRKKQAASMAPLRDAQADQLRAIARTPEFRRARAEALRERWKDPEFRQMQAERLRKLNASRRART